MVAILNSVITGAGTFTGSIYQTRLPSIVPFIEAQATFTYGSGGVSVLSFLQTSADKLTWNDILAFNKFTTVTASSFLAVQQFVDGMVQNVDGQLAPGLVVSGLLFDLYWRVKYIVAGTYAGNTTLSVNASTDNDLVLAPAVGLFFG